MSESLLQSAKRPPAGWSVTLIRSPSRPTCISLRREMGRTATAVMQSGLAETRALARHLHHAHGACDYASPHREPAPQIYFALLRDWTVGAYQCKGRAPYITLRRSNAQLHDYVSVDHQLSRADTRLLANALDELLALLDAGPSELPPDVDPNPERVLPGYRAPDGLFVPEYLRSAAATAEALS